jgi:hypothetical protein
MAITANGVPITSSLIKNNSSCPSCGAEEGANCIDSNGRRKSSGGIHLLRRIAVYRILESQGLRVERVQKEES